MSAAKIRKGDKVVVLSGRDKGKTGEVTMSMPKDGKATRVRFEVAKDGKKVRVAARSGEKSDG